MTASLLEQTLELLDTVKGNINPERGYAEELERDIQSLYVKVAAAIEAAKSVEPVATMFVENDGTIDIYFPDHSAALGLPSGDYQVFIAPPAQPVPAWKPIETAPKDGTRILLARCGRDESKAGRGVWWACKGFWSDNWNNWNDGLEPAGLAGPTHWMPLPAAPEAQT